jgi:hypothetical protein
MVADREQALISLLTNFYQLGEKFERADDPADRLLSFLMDFYQLGGKFQRPDPSEKDEEEVRESARKQRENQETPSLKPEDPCSQILELCEKIRKF